MLTSRQRVSGHLSITLQESNMVFPGQQNKVSAAVSWVWNRREEGTYRPAADRQKEDGSKTGGRAEIIQRPREECCIDNKVESCEVRLFPHTSESKSAFDLP